MNSRKKTVRYHGLEIGHEVAKAFRNKERRLRRAIDVGTYPCAQNILGEIKLDAGDNEDLQLVFEEIRKNATARWTQSHGRILSAKRINEVVLRCFCARMEWFLSFAFAVHGSGADVLNAGIVTATEYEERLEPLYEEKSQEFDSVFNELSAAAKRAWYQLQDAQDMLSTEVYRITQ